MSAFAASSVFQNDSGTSEEPWRECRRPRKLRKICRANEHACRDGTARPSWFRGRRNGGSKVRGDSFNYEVQDVLEEAGKWGFVLEGKVQERGIEEEDVGEGRLLGNRGRKWIGVRVWFGMVLRLVG